MSDPTTTFGERLAELLPCSVRVRDDSFTGRRSGSNLLRGLDVRLGIVGHAAEKFDERTALLARSEMMKFIEEREVDLIVSGRSVIDQRR